MSGWLQCKGRVFSHVQNRGVSSTKEESSRDTGTEMICYGNSNTGDRPPRGDTLPPGGVPQSRNPSGWGLCIMELLAACLLGLASTSSLSASDGTELQPHANGEDMVWRSEKMCGVNCVYFLLRAGNIIPDYERLSREMVRQDSLTSLTDLKRCAETHGLRCALGKTNPAGLGKLPMPLIAHFDLVGVRGKSGGHFVVVLRANDDGVVYVDGTLAEIRVVSAAEFQRVWSGYILYMRSRPRVFDWLWMAGAVLGGALLGFTMERAVRRHPAEAPRFRM